MGNLKIYGSLFLVVITTAGGGRGQEMSCHALGALLKEDGPTGHSGRWKPVCNYLSLEPSCALHRRTVVTAAEFPGAACHNHVNEEWARSGILWDWVAGRWGLTRGWWHLRLQWRTPVNNPHVRGSPWRAGLSDDLPSLKSLPSTDMLEHMLFCFTFIFFLTLHIS